MTQMFLIIMNIRVPWLKKTSARNRTEVLKKKGNDSLETGGSPYTSRKTRVTLWPPKPELLLMAILTGASRLTLGT